jgi:serine/threonine-protein kinase
VALAHPPPHEAELHAGRELGPYELLVPIGSGGMAEVWVARHTATRAVFALKMLRPHLAENTAFREMFFDEARIASRIRHPNVCATYELVELEGILALVMEWVDGSSLVHMIQPSARPEADRDAHGDREDVPRLALPIRHAVRIVAETCAGLHAAHELLGDDGRPLSVVHRDVSPHNILVTRDGRVKVTDFGVAKALGKLHMTIAGQVKGKLAYMSPEQLVGAGVDRRSDVFALGTVLYEATTGVRPFRGQHDPQVMSAIVMGNFDPPSAVVASYPRELEEIVLAAMATEAGARPATADELGRALVGWLESSGPVLGTRQIASLVRERCGAELDARASALSVPPRRPGRSEPVRYSSLPPKPRRGVGPAGGAAAVLLGVILGLGVLFYVRETRRARAAAAFARLTSVDPPAPRTSATNTAPPAPEPEVLNVGELDDPPAPAALGRVTLLVPEGAKLFIDGRWLAPGTTTIARPDAGTRAVLVHADGREDTTVIIDSTTPDEIEVTMAPRAKRRSAPSTVVMPPNPYE